MKYRKCSSSEAASHGHDSGSGNGRKGSANAHMTPPASAIAVISSSLLVPDFAIAFHDACINAASSTSSVTSTGKFIPPCGGWAPYYLAAEATVHEFAIAR